MKKIKQFVPILAILTFALSCSSDDGGTIPIITNPPSDNTGNYFPLTEDDYWNYDVAYRDNNDSNNNSDSADFLFVDTQLGSTYDLGVNTNDIANGTMNAILVNGTLERTESTLLLDGSIAIPFPGFETSNIDFTDIILYDLNASNNSLLSSNSGTIVQDVDLGGDIVPITINYIISSNQENNDSSITVNGESYSSVSKANFKINLDISTIVTFGTQNINLPIISSQDVSVSTNYFVENVGLVKSETTITYQINQSTIDLLNTIGVEIPFPTSGSATNVQELTDYMVTIE
ncbi:hypothetical protein C1T31_08350 [Hanstruepera neustonica]|uniref:Uncharacterized protein n=1 Tax=Hanstruepera neustonica TaxID=1445657 RepID=A0A2K1DY97_9FLAO|nr:hypothetical protein [Hanstruepera neustonica]PNQ72999.1 hypothetical protein C1T31_08350 [Hanstruepera neustonica]